MKIGIWDSKNQELAETFNENRIWDPQNRELAQTFNEQWDLGLKKSTIC